MATENNHYATLMDPASERAKRGAFFFFMLFNFIIFAAFLMERFMFGGYGHAPAALNLGLGAGMVVLMLLSLVPVTTARKRLAAGDDAGAIGSVGMLLAVPVLMIAGTVYSWTELPIGSGFGGIFDVTGIWFVLHFALTALAMLAVIMKGKRAPERARRERWVVYNVLSYWGMLVFLWAAFFVVFYVA